MKPDARRRRATGSQRELRRKRAKETIRLCHLTRRRLRKERFRFIEKVIKAVRIHELALSQNNAVFAQEARELVDLFVAADSPFAGTARFVDRNRQAFIAA